MTRRVALKLSAVTTAAALLAGCPKKLNDRERRRAHGLAMFLLMFKYKTYLQEAVSNTPQDQLPANSLLRKVMPSVFDNMRAYYQSQATTDTALADLVKRYNAMADELYAATKWVKPGPAPQSGPLDQPPYSTPDECPCVDDKVQDSSCPAVEALLQ